MGGLFDFNISAWFIDVWAKFGWAYDLKKVSQAMIERRMKRTGDGSSWLSYEESHKHSVWGYGDEGMNETDKRELNNSAAFSHRDDKQQIEDSLKFKIF